MAKARSAVSAVRAVRAVWVGLFAALLGVGCGPERDEARRAGRTAESFRSADPNYFAGMDGGALERADLPPALRESAVKGRNMWMVWTGGNDRFWNHLASGETYGTFDLLKILSTHPEALYHDGSREERCRDVDGDGRIDARDGASPYGPGYGAGRSAECNGRWAHLGLVNHPCFERAEGPDPRRYGLRLDRFAPSAACPLWRDGKPLPQGDPAYRAPDFGGAHPDPFADPSVYPGVAIGARGKDVPAGSFYGEPSGVLGLRLFPNPDFDETAAKRWDAERYYTDPDYYYDKDLVRPYRVGMSCAFCHVGPSPVNPPANPEKPQWANLNGNVGAQYYWVDRIFFWNNGPRSGDGAPSAAERNFVFQLFHTNPPGSLDTSLVSTDNINNPRTMNAVYSLGARLAPALQWGREQLDGGSLDNRQFDPDGLPPDFERYGLGRFFEPPDTVSTPRVLKDGADSVGALGALNRVYINIGLYSEEWLRHFTFLVGFKAITPIRIADAREHSVYWQVTERDTPHMAAYFLESALPDRLLDAPGGAERIDLALVERGRDVFAETCARCHSSKLPALPPDVSAGCEGGGNGSRYLECFDRFWQWTKGDAFKAEMRRIAQRPDFLEQNFLSTEQRVPVTLLQTNACSPLATNAIEGDIWDNFSSRSYKELPGVGTITVHDPFTGEEKPYVMRAGGRGYTRPASLASVWSTAPFLLNNSVGRFTFDPTVEARLASFDDSIDRLLWPLERVDGVRPEHRHPGRKRDPQHAAELGLPAGTGVPALPGYVYRTTAASCLTAPNAALPRFARPALGLLASHLLTDQGVALGPIPAGTPVNLLANLEVVPEPTGVFDRLSHRVRLGGLLFRVNRSLREIGGACAEEDLAAMDTQGRALQVYRDAGLASELMAFSKCPDYVVNRGHYFGTELFDERDFRGTRWDAEGRTARDERDDGGEAPLSDADRWALVEFLKTL